MFKTARHRFRRNAQVRAPIFIVGCARSGTTLLFQLLAEHNKLTATTGYPDGEDHEGWITLGKASISGLGDPQINNGHTGLPCCLPMTEQEFTDEARSQMVNHYSSLLTKNRKNRVINKCPHLSNKLRYVRSIFPDAKFIHIIRDCVPVVASLCKMMEAQTSHVLYWPGGIDACLWMLEVPNETERTSTFASQTNMYPGGGFLSLADYWSCVNTHITQQLTENDDALLTLRYEDLVSNPKSTLDAITDHCDLEKFEALPTDKWSRPVLTDRNAKQTVFFNEPSTKALLEKSISTRRKFGYVS